ncbi:MAG: hypothetical protein LBV45_04130 [Xanthomonadaceae bacterium]|jgi:hypothetical protein|nr:hypothetical protein [Xanthomonadaceae bacterium]
MHVRQYVVSAAIVALALGLSACFKVESPPAPIQLDGQTFPALTIAPEHMATSDCSQVRAKRVDELDSHLRQVVDRIAFHCTMQGDMGLNTMTTAHLAPGRVEFLSIPVIEVRVSESENHWETQYILTQDFSSAHVVLKQYLETLMQGDDCVGGPSCSLDDRYDAQGNREDGMILSLPDNYRISIYPDSDDPARTIYIRQWHDQDHDIAYQ